MKKLIYAIVLLLCGTAAYAIQDVDGTTDALAQKIEKEIRKEDKVNIEHLRVLHKDGTVYLEGTTTLYGSRYKAGEIAEEEDGVKKVDNQIVVKRRDVSDNELEIIIMERIRKHLGTSPFDLISVKANNGFVRLGGYVRDISLKKDAFRETIWTPGVKEVQNGIKLAAVSTADDRLRTGIFRILSRNYPHYFTGRSPSVLILVENGRVTLFGSVRSNVDKQRMVSDVRSIPGVLSVTDQLQGS